jgi:hypothetical protein
MIQVLRLFGVFLFLEITVITTALITSTRPPLLPRAFHLRSSNENGGRTVLEEEIHQGLQRARAILEKSKAKLAAREALPFFAQPQEPPPVSRAGVVKAVHPVSGLIQADGEKMAAISEQEAWEFRSLVEVFNENEMTEEEDRYSLASQQLAKRDVAESIFQLRKELQTEDYRRIFDTNNRFIGEDN